MQQLNAMQTRFFAGLPNHENTIAERAGEAGLNRLDLVTEATTNIETGIRLTVRQATGVIPDPACAQQRLAQRQERSSAKAAQCQAYIASLAQTLTPLGVNPRRAVVACLLATASILILRLNNVAMRWEHIALAAIAATLAGFGPWGAAAQCRRAFASMCRFGAFLTAAASFLALKVAIAREQHLLEESAETNALARSLESDAVAKLVAIYAVERKRGEAAACE